MPYPHYESWILQIPPWLLKNQQFTSEKLRLGRYRQRSKETLQWCFEDSQVLIKVNFDPLEPVVAFPYLGRTIVYKNSGCAAMYQNLVKARRWWVMVLGVMDNTGMLVQVREIIYKAVVQMVILYRSNS